MQIHGRNLRTTDRCHLQERGVGIPVMAKGGFRCSVATVRRQTKIPGPAVIVLLFQGIIRPTVGEKRGSLYIHLIGGRLLRRVTVAGFHPYPLAHIPGNRRINVYRLR